MYDAAESITIAMRETATTLMAYFLLSPHMESKEPHIASKAPASRIIGSIRRVKRLNTGAWVSAVPISAGVMPNRLIADGRREFRNASLSNRICGSATDTIISRIDNGSSNLAHFAADGGFSCFAL